MKTKSYWLLILAALAFLTLSGWPGYGQKQGSSRTVWEYKIVSESDKVSLNDMGAEGWELVTVEMGGAQEVYYFKRTK